MEQRERNSKIWRRGQKIGFLKVSQVDSGFWKESKWKDANKKEIRSYNRCEERICIQEGEDISIVERRERRGVQVYKRTIEKEVYQTLKVALNSISIFCRKERQ